MLSSERCMALAELAGGGERFGTGEQQLDAPVAGRSRREETEGRSEPACGARRCTRGRRLSRVSQERDRSLVALACGAFDVVGDRRGQRASEGESVGAALVRAEPPAAGHRLVHRAADERMPEAEAPGNVRLTDEIQAQQLVDRVDRCRLGGSGGRGGQLGIEGLSRDGSALEDEACLLGEQSELLGERGGDRSRDIDAGERRLVGRRRRVGDGSADRASCSR